MPVADPTLSSAARRRLRSLEGHVEHLRNFLVSQTGAAGSLSPLELPAVGSELTLEPWLVARLREEFAATATDEAGVLTQSVALLIKCRIDSDRLATTGKRDEKLYAVEAELMLDLGVGLALSRELQQLVDETVRRGDVQTAKQLSRFHHTVRAASQNARGALAAKELERAEAWTDSLTEIPQAAAVRPGDAELQRLAWQAGDDHDRERLRAFRSRTLSLAAWLPSRTESLVALLGILLTAWLCVVSLPEMLSTPPPSVTLDDLPSRGVIVEVESRQPSLYATIDAGAWNALDDVGRRRVVRNLSSLLLTYGYTGTLLRRPDGRPVARWLGQRGVELLDGDEAAHAPGSVMRVPGADGTAGPIGGPAAPN